MFIDERTQNQIHANLNQSVSWGTLKLCDLIPKFLDVIKDTPEYAQMMLAPAVSAVPSYAMEDKDSEWWDSPDAEWVYVELYVLLQDYAPEGYYFGTHPGDGSDYGFWKSEETD